MFDQLQEVDLGIPSADAERVQLSLVCGDLFLSFIDWNESFRQYKFTDVLEFKWQAFDLGDARDDVSYLVLNSKWLLTQAALQSEKVNEFNHFKICFNTLGMLDVLCKQVVPHA